MALGRPPDLGVTRIVAQISAARHVVFGAAVLPGGSEPVVACQTPWSSFRVRAPAAKPVARPTPFHIIASDAITLQYPGRAVPNSENAR